jgi:hypothetical protein
VCRLEEEFDKDAVLSPILFNLYSECLTKEAHDGLGDFKLGWQIIQTVTSCFANTPKRGLSKPSCTYSTQHTKLKVM